MLELDNEEQTNPIPVYAMFVSGIDVRAVIIISVLCACA